MVEVKEKKPAGLYVHIPFCVKKCAYCDFLSASASEEIKERYVNWLCEEIEREADWYSGYQGRTVFFGGGTPTVLMPEQLERILYKLENCFSVKVRRKADIIAEKKIISGGMTKETDRTKISGTKTEEMEESEITIECNPGTADEKSLRKLRDMGVNRLSIGLQSAQDEELKKLGRIHSWEDFLETYHAARKAGFQNINVDIMSALPGQSPDSYVDTLRKVTALCPEHISAYSLMIEVGTPFYARYGEADRQRQKYGEDKEHLLPTEEEERRMYDLTQEILARKGYHRYEISNYALPGYECRHNITYWKRGDYLGIGLGAASLMENCRFTKTRDLKEYEDAFRRDRRGERSAVLAEEKRDKKRAFPEAVSERQNMAGSLHREEQYLAVQEQMEEFMFLGLRLTEGISAKEFQEYFHVPIEDIYGDILNKLKKQKLLAWSGDRIFLTKRGIDVSNSVLAEFLL